MSFTRSLIFALLALVFSNVQGQTLVRSISDKGIYFGTFSNGDEFALVISKQTDGAIFIVGRNNGYYGFANLSLTVSGFGTAFSVVVNGETVTGEINSSGQLSGRISARNLTFSGVKTPVTRNSGYYFGEGDDAQGRAGFYYFVFGGNGQALYYRRSPVKPDDGGVGQVDANRAFSVTDAFGIRGQGQFTTELEAGLGFVGTFSKSTDVNQRYLALSKNAGYKFVNIATRGLVGNAGQVMIAGFVISGGAKTVLIRGIGPALGAFGVADTLEDPQITLANSRGNTLLVNDNWGAGTVSTQIAEAAQMVGAFPLPSGSLDASILVSLEPGSYTVQLSGNTGKVGVGLVEVYEVD